MITFKMEEEWLSVELWPSPQIGVLTPVVPQNNTFFGDRVFTEVINLK